MEAPEVVAFIFLVLISLFIYFIPATVAVMRHHPWSGSIVVINVGLGWTVAGWVIALAWAVGRTSPSEHGSDADSPARSDDPWPRRGLLDEVTR